MTLDVVKNDPGWTSPLHGLFRSMGVKRLGLHLQSADSRAKRALACGCCAKEISEAKKLGQRAVKKR